MMRHLSRSSAAFMTDSSTRLERTNRESYIRSNTTFSVSAYRIMNAGRGTGWRTWTTLTGTTTSSIELTEKKVSQWIVSYGSQNFSSRIGISTGRTMVANDEVFEFISGLSMPRINQLCKIEVKLDALSPYQSIFGQVK